MEEYKSRNPEREEEERMKIKKLVEAATQSEKKKSKKKTKEELEEILIIIEDEGVNLTVNQRVEIWKKSTGYSRGTYFQLKSAGSYYGHKRIDLRSALDDGTASKVIKHLVERVGKPKAESNPIIVA